jgi:SpoIID/LytB domain protein
MAERGRSALIGVALAIALVGADPSGSTSASEDDVHVDGVVRLHAEDDAAITIDGSRAYLGTVELHPDGQLINELDLEHYVQGVAEMPSRWHGEALKAQAVAARTYAWWHAARADGRSDLCATTACQVYRGVEVTRDGGERWAAAVEQTRGEVLLDADGGPVLARYFSTSGGRTFDNEAVFPSTGPRPELVGIEDPADEVSPYHRWTASFDRELFDELLTRGETLAAAVPVADVERIGDVDDPRADVRVTGEDGTSVEVGAGALRDFLSRVAPSVDPAAYPGRTEGGLRRLPATVPSTRFEIEVDTDEVVLHGRGWGHGVGMGQYGARGRAEDGASYRDILASYYGGTEPTTTDELPSTIRVDLDRSDEVTFRGESAITIEDGGGVVAERALGTWTATRHDGGWQLSAPEGSGADLEVAATRDVGEADDAVTVGAEVNKPVELTLEVHDADGEAVVTRELGVAEAGSHTATWRYLDEAGEPVPAGEYAVRLTGRDATGTTAGEALTVSVPERSAPAGSTPWRGDGSLVALVVVAAIAVPVALAAIWIGTRKARR